MRIGFDAIRALHNGSGLGNYSRGVLRGLHAIDPSLELHLYSPKPPADAFRDLPMELHATLHLPGPRALGSGLLPWRTFQLGRAAARDRVEIYHGLTHEIPRDLPRTGVPSIVTFHDLLFETHPEFFPMVDRASYRWRYRWSARNATAIVAVSEQTRADLIELYRIDSQRITVIPPARDPRFATVTDPATRAAARSKYDIPGEYLLAIGTLESRKNQDVLIRAAGMLPTDSALPLVLVGRDGGSQGALVARAHQLGIAARVLIRTDVATADLPAILQGATLFLYPSLAEGFGMPIVEALSASVAVIASIEGRLAEAGGAGSRYVAARDPAAWAGAITELVNRSAATDTMIAAGGNHAGQFDGARVAARLLAVYDAVVSRQTQT